MPLYELFCMARPALARPDAAQLMRNVAAAVLNKDGILTDIKSFGDHPLAYTIRRPGQRYEEVRCMLSHDIMPSIGWRRWGLRPGDLNQYLHCLQS